MTRFLSKICRTAFAAGALAAAALPAQSATSNNTEQYQYDARGRLIQVTTADGTIIQYSYDAAGNRTAAIIASSTWGSFNWGSGTWR